MPILVLYGEKIVRDAAVSALSRAGYTVVEADTPEAALEAAHELDDIDLFTAGHRLRNGKSGRDVAEELLRRRPKMRVLHISGYPIGVQQSDNSMAPGSYYLAKPFLPRQLVAKVQDPEGRLNPVPGVGGTPYSSGRRARSGRPANAFLRAS
jgi:DNA-binding NtrC family response regulator